MWNEKQRTKVSCRAFCHTNPSPKKNPSLCKSHLSTWVGDGAWRLGGETAVEVGEECVEGVECCGGRADLHGRVQAVALAGLMKGLRTGPVWRMIRGGWWLRPRVMWAGAGLG